MRRYLALLILLIPACGGPPGAAETEQATSTALVAGGPGFFYGPTSTPITEAWFKAQMPFPPQAPRAESGFHGSYWITNQGGTYGENNLMFLFDLVPGAQPHYTCRALAMIVDDVGTLTHHTAQHLLFQVDVGQRQWCEFTWNAISHVVELSVQDIGQTQINYLSSTVSWPLGAQPTYAHSPNLNFSLKYPINTYNSCFHDLPGYDDNVNDDAHVKVQAEYSTSYFTTYPAPMLPNLPYTCALTTTNYSGYDIVSWHTGG
jgi:hypothetical protein